MSYLLCRTGARIVRIGVDHRLGCWVLMPLNIICDAVAWVALEPHGSMGAHLRREAEARELTRMLSHMAAWEPCSQAGRQSWGGATWSHGSSPLWGGRVRRAAMGAEPRGIMRAFLYGEAE
jgi:hypothetical protein